MLIKLIQTTPSDPVYQTQITGIRIKRIPQLRSHELPSRNAQLQALFLVKRPPPNLELCMYVGPNSELSIMGTLHQNKRPLYNTLNNKIITTRIPRNYRRSP